MGRIIDGRQSGMNVVFTAKHRIKNARETRYIQNKKMKEKVIDWILSIMIVVLATKMKDQGCTMNYITAFGMCCLHDIAMNVQVQHIWLISELVLALATVVIATTSRRWTEEEKTWLVWNWVVMWAIHIICALTGTKKLIQKKRNVTVEFVKTQEDIFLMPAKKVRGVRKKDNRRIRKCGPTKCDTKEQNGQDLREGSRTAGPR